MRYAHSGRAGWTNGLLTLGAILAGVLLVEGLARLLGYDYGVDHNWRYDPVVGWTQRAGASYRIERPGLSFEVAFNAAGFRDREHLVAKPPGMRRIVVIGDSFSEAIQVPFEDVWHQRLGPELAAAGVQRIEVLNFGVGDYGTAQELLILERALAYEPDVVVQQIFPLNDVCNNNPALAGLCRSLNDGYRPYFDLQGSELVPLARQPVRKWLRDHLLTWFIVERRLRWALALGADEAFWQRRFAAAGFAVLDPMLWSYVPDAGVRHPVIEAGWHLTEALLTETVRRSRAHGARYVALVVPFEARIEPNWSSFRSESAARQAMDGNYPEQRLGALFERLGVPMVALKPHLEARFDAVLPYWQGHLSPSAHALTADVLAAALLELLSDERPAAPHQRRSS